MEINSQVNIKTLSWTAINFRSSKSAKKHSKDVAQSKNPDTSIVLFCTILLAISYKGSHRARKVKFF